MSMDPNNFFLGRPSQSPNAIIGKVAPNTAATPAPTTFDESMYVMLIDHSPDLAYPVAFAALHGTALPQPGAKVLVVYDNHGVPYVVWWEGTYAP